MERETDIPSHCGSPTHPSYWLFSCIYYVYRIRKTAIERTTDLDYERGQHRAARGTQVQQKANRHTADEIRTTVLYYSSRNGSKCIMPRSLAQRENPEQQTTRIQT
ncbi:hypothetical protein ASPBRDRAFT_659803 [Aspergillus brasiliensis CBS 101740]|uniref:Uncharacterized protein n=1 Tax=Aspergillus brasiliensis (strain CBS 101740 / IMI 381727 / IBT 21946) TaxID=767769 RepID=A0A1L9U972_ASPBC|nr:hypothetical protein ASPBRDRAFT_659803 [Aspergillus brasiliensis CBS 101740]